MAKNIDKIAAGLGARVVGKKSGYSGNGQALGGERLAIFLDASTLPQDVLLEDKDPLLARPDAARVSTGRHALLLILEYGDIFRYHFERGPPADNAGES